MKKVFSKNIQKQVSSNQMLSDVHPFKIEIFIVKSFLRDLQYLYLQYQI